MIRASSAAMYAEMSGWSGMTTRLRGGGGFTQERHLVYLFHVLSPWHDPHNLRTNCMKRLLPCLLALFTVFGAGLFGERPTHGNSDVSSPHTSHTGQGLRSRLGEQDSPRHQPLRLRQMASRWQPSSPIPTTMRTFTHRTWCWSRRPPERRATLPTIASMFRFRAGRLQETGSPFWWKTRTSITRSSCSKCPAASRSN